MAILAFTGRIGAGKTTAAQYVARTYGFKSLSFVERILAPRLVAQGKLVNRQNLQEIGSKLYLEHGDIVLTQWLLQGIDFSQKWLIDDVRYPSTAQYIKSCFHGQFMLVGVRSDQHMRYERVVKRAKEKIDSFEGFLVMDTALTEKQIDEVMNCADRIIDNMGTENDLYASCDLIVREILNKSGDEHEHS